jgi:raffinose/stachyose/melibiose transport system substrate-binding protein
MRTLATALAAALAVTGLAACGGGGGESGSSDNSVYFLNFKPEVATVYAEIAEAYTAETGVKVRVESAASGTYEQQLRSEIAKADAPTIFQVNGPVGYATWKDYTADVKDSQLYQHMVDQSMAIAADGGVYAIPYVVEGYGIIYNDAIMTKYFALPDKKVSIKSAAEITSFDLLKAVVEDMTAHKDDLGIQGAFSATSLKPGEDWRWQTHLADVPFYYEFTDDEIDLSQGTPAEVSFSYNKNYRNLFDLYLDNSTTEKGQLGAKTVDDAMAEFALGQSAMVQNGNWGWGQISDVAGNTVKAEDVHFLPLYTGVSDDKSQGLCIGTENYFAVNSKVSPEKQQASLDFLYWLFSSDTGKKYVTEDLGFITPFDTFAAGEGPSDPLAVEVSNWMAKDVTTVPWVFTVFPSQQFKNDFGGMLLQYAQGKAEWQQVVDSVIENWKAQVAAAG